MKITQQSVSHGASPLFDIVRFMIALLFVIGTIFYARSLSTQIMLISAAVIGAYMAMNIGANDVANNVGPAVGSKAMTMTGAVIIALIFEAAGAMIAGGDVVSTIKDGIIDPAQIHNTNDFIWLMMAALLAAALWLHIATAMGAPVSTTHAIVGAILGSGIAAGGLDIADWGVMGKIAASWVISPVLGGIIAAAFLYLIKRTITYQTDMIAASKNVVPLLIALMAWSFITYLLLKGLKQIYKLDFKTAAGISLFISIALYLILRPTIARTAEHLENTKANVNALFSMPLVFAAALLSFAHGANDVANAVGPLAAVNDAIFHGGVTQKATIPLWVMLIGALGICTGLGLYGPKLIRTVGSEITDLDKMRAFCTAMSAAVTVIIASQLGLPVSSTHIAVGAVFGVGFLREYLKNSYAIMISEIKRHHADSDPEQVNRFLRDFEEASTERKAAMLKEMKRKGGEENALTKPERKSLKKVYRQELVKRSHLYRIAAAWIITVPCSAFLGALLYYTIRGMMMPG
ncbi:MAG: inorganic phosphate transporter [Gammaproteobacteria bacterium]